MPSTSTVAAVGSALLATMAYLGLLVVGFLLLWALLGAVELLPRDSPLTASGPGRQRELGRGMLLFGGLALWAWGTDRWIRGQWERRVRRQLVPLPLVGPGLPTPWAALFGGGLVVVGVWMGGARIAPEALPFDTQTWFLAGLFLLVAAALEEIALRGFLLSVWVATLGPKTALLVTSLLFSWLHQSNPGASVLGLVNTVLAGWVLGEMALRAGSLAPPIALHFVWNWAQGLLLGLPISGQRASTSILTLEPGTGLLAGDAYGFEGGLAATLVLSLGLAWALWPPGPRSEQGTSPSDE